MSVVTTQPLSTPTVSRQSSMSTKGKSPEKGSLTPSKSSLKRPKSARSTTAPQEGDEAAWGSNFWVTLVDPQTNNSFYACPATGQVSWDPPVGNFVLPPSAEGEWWELSDDSRGGLSYYYQTKTGETVWERPQGFVIPLGIIQNSALGRRLSNRVSKTIPPESAPNTTATTTTPDRPSFKRAQSFTNGRPNPSGSAKKQSPSARRSFSNDQYNNNFNPNGTQRLHTIAQHLPPIPASPYSSEGDTPSQKSRKLSSSNSASRLQVNHSQASLGKRSATPDTTTAAQPRSKSSSYISHRPLQPQSLNAAVEMLTSTTSESNHSVSSSTPSTIDVHPPQSTTRPQPPKRPIPALPGKNSISGKTISAPILNQAATIDMSPVKNRATGQPILVQPRVITVGAPTATLSSGRTYPALPIDLASDILQFSESAYAKQYFSTHRTGFIFRRRVPVSQMMVWQKAPLTAPLLTLSRELNKHAVKAFKIVQHIMGDRERVVGRIHSEHASTVPSLNSSTASLSSSTSSSTLEQERFLLGEGLTHGELRDEIYCQVMKQLTSNPSAESIFKGWQLICVLLITFPPSKNFETYLNSFIQQHTSKQEGRVDIMAKYCLRRLSFIARKGPRGKPPTAAEIETASDAAFNPSTFGESLDAIIRLQERNYPHQKVPIILPFLADGILALGGTKAEGIFRVPGDGDSVSDLKLRIDKGYYTLDGVDDPHILASLMKLWLRELCDPLVPEEMYNECISSSKDPEACVHIVERLPTINRRVVLFVVSFLQLFLDDRTQTLTKMTPANLALVMAPNLLRCNSESMAVVFTNAQYEQIFVYNLLLNLKCSEVDADYTPAHGLGAVPAIAVSRPSKSRNRRNPY